MTSFDIELNYQRNEIGDGFAYINDKRRRKNESYFIRTITTE